MDRRNLMTVILRSEPDTDAGTDPVSDIRNSAIHRNAHMAPVPSLTTIPLILADAPFSTNTRIFAPLAGPLAIAALFALPAALAAGFGGEVFLADG